MKVKIVYLKSKTSFKTNLKSDTLWGHLCWAIHNIYGKGAVESFIKDEPCIISSTFPYVEKDNVKTEFFPKPTQYESPKPIDEKLTFEQKLGEMTKRKKEKKASKWLSKAQFIAFINGNEIPKAENTVPKQHNIVVTKNKIDRFKGGTLKIGDAGQLFHVEENYFSSQNTGLFFLVKGNDFALLEGALRYLNHVGLGGNRSIGKGHFEISELIDYNLQEPTEALFQTNLSLYHPSEEELNTLKSSDSSNYVLEDRKGRLGFMNYKNVTKKNAFLFFKEGSFFPFQGKESFGRILEVETEINLPHKVYHNGKGFMINIKK